MEPTVKVVFRRWKDGAVIALFPEVINYPDGSCESYMRVGQHSAASYPHVVAVTHPAKPEEYASLKRELEGIGYVLKVSKRFTPSKR